MGQNISLRIRLFVFLLSFVIKLCLWASLLSCVNSKGWSKIRDCQVADPGELQNLAMAMGGRVTGEDRGASEQFLPFLSPCHLVYLFFKMFSFLVASKAK